MSFDALLCKLNVSQSRVGRIRASPNQALPHQLPDSAGGLRHVELSRLRDVSQRGPRVLSDRREDAPVSAADAKLCAAGGLGVGTAVAISQKKLVVQQVVQFHWGEQVGGHGEQRDLQTIGNS